MTDDDRDIVLGGTTRSGRVAGRWLAAAFDLVVGAYAVGSALTAAASLGLLESTLPAGLGLAVLWFTLVAVEGLTGRSPGKHIADIAVARVDGGRPGLREAALRRPWVAPLLLAPFGDGARAIGTIAALLVLAVIGVTTVRASDGRGLHDRLADTVVVPAPGARRAAAVTIGITMLVILLTAAVRALAATS